ncbi:hypothetical protein NQ314_000817 [Rhamnusium bicolor]|uniref:Thioredoxin domain-containing protein n=1 Tax=Rhamnusium bicolor TaxID=1586634 RepID=A0AAV8ZTN7_9CUCU|nr:hypothetical protein NQ314_000817 [Rhamnusium bicolor]
MMKLKNTALKKIPSLVYFENGIPTLYEGNLEDEDKVLKWFEHQIKSDEIEDVTDEMLDIILDKRPFVAVLFCMCIIMSICFYGVLKFLFYFR